MLSHLTLLPLALLASCALTWSDTRVESSVALAPGQHATLEVQGPGSCVTLRLQGASAGAVVFEIRAVDGTVLARGVLDYDSTASSTTNQGHLLVDLQAGDQGGWVEYTAYGEAGVGVELALDQP